MDLCLFLSKLISLKKTSCILTEMFLIEGMMEDYQLYELIFKAPNYERVYFEDKYLVTGHLPTRAIYGAKPDEIYIANNHIATDCASGYGGKVGCIRLDDFKCFYSVENGGEK